MSNTAKRHRAATTSWFIGITAALTSLVGCRSLPTPNGGQLPDLPRTGESRPDVGPESEALAAEGGNGTSDVVAGQQPLAASTERGLAAPVVSASANQPVAPTAIRRARPQPIPVSMASCGIFNSKGCQDGSCGPACGSSQAASCGCGADSCNQLPAGCIPGAQEFIFDGGDQAPAVMIDDNWSAYGLDPTDTVAYYETETGELCIQPSNRVPIYAPRFGAVRQVSGAELATKTIGTERFLVPVAPGRFDDTDLAGTVMQPQTPLGKQQVALIEAFRERNAGVPVEGILPPLRMSEALVPFEEIEILATGVITDDEIAVMGRILQNAQAWYVPENLGVMVDGQAAVAMIDTKVPLGLHVYDIPGKCTLRVCKTASHTIANSGDIVNFTIRFDNVGDKPVGNVVLVDSLSPRLEYIEGSQQSSVETRFSTEPNEVGSEVLRWELVAPVDNHDGGIVSFDCRVR